MRVHLLDPTGAEYGSSNPIPLQIGQAPHFETVAASQTDQVLGTTGAIGNILTALVITVTTAATAAVSIKDGAGASIPVFPNSPTGGVGAYTVNLGMVSASGAWKVTTGAGSSVIASGTFT